MGDKPLDNTIIVALIAAEAGRTFEPVGAYTARTVLIVDGEAID